MSLIATRTAQLAASADLDKNIARAQQYGALDLFTSQTEAADSLISDDLKEKALRSAGNTVGVAVTNYTGDIAITNTRTCVIADDNNTSANYIVAFATFHGGFTMVEAQYQNNDIAYQKDWNKKMMRLIRGMGNALDNAALAALEANKTQVFNNLLTYTQTGNTVQAGWDSRMDILGDIGPIMSANDFFGNIHLVGNAGLQSLLMKLAQRGDSNDVNKTNEWFGKTIHYTNNIANGVGKYASIFAVESGNVGIVTRSGRQNLLGRGANDHEWDIVNMPGLNLPVDTHYYTSVGDFSAISGAATADMTCVVKDHYGFSIDVAFIVAHNNAPTTQANPIVKIAIDSAVGSASAVPVRVVNTNTSPVFTKEVPA